MKDQSANLYASIIIWPPKDEMVRLLKESGLNITVGKYSITVDDCSYFRFQEYGGDLGNPCITADADNVEEMIKDASLVSNALTKGGVSHIFEVHDHEDNLVKIIKYENNS